MANTNLPALIVSADITDSLISISPVIWYLLVSGLVAGFGLIFGFLMAFSWQSISVIWWYLHESDSWFIAVYASA